MRFYMDQYTIAVTMPVQKIKYFYITMLEQNNHVTWYKKEKVHKKYLQFSTYSYI